MLKSAIQLRIKQLQEKYQLTTNDIKIGNELWKVYSIANYEDLITQLLERDDNDPYLKDERIPYWAEIWPSSIALARHLQSSSYALSGSLVLEIGCGLGLSGLSAMKMGAKVMMTDYLPESFELVELNGLVNVGTLPTCKVLDWREFQYEKKYDWVLAADVAYEVRAFEPLLQAFHYFVQSGAVVLLSEPNRTMAKKFVKSFEKEGFRINRSDIPIDFQQNKTLISIYELRI